MTIYIDKFSFISEQTLFNSGEYRVRYTTGRGDYYEALLGKEHHLIEEVLERKNVKKKILQELKETVKVTGLHYSIHNTLKTKQHGSIYSREA